MGNTIRKINARVLLLLVLAASGAFSQNEVIDSLKVVLKTAGEDTNKANTLNQLSWEFSRIDPEKGIYYGMQGLAFAEKMGYKKQTGDACHVIAWSNDVKGDYNEALKYNERALAIRELINDEKGQAGSHNNTGLIYMKKGNYSEALRNFFAAMKFNEKMGNKKGISTLYSNIGNAYTGMKNYKDGLSYYRKALLIKKEIGDKSGYARVCTNLGAVYEKMGNYAEALRNQQEALKVKKEIGDNITIGISYNNIAVVYDLMAQSNAFPGKKQKDSLSALALEANFTSLKLKEEVKDPGGIASSCINIGGIYSFLGNSKSAICYLDRALELALSIGDNEEIRDSYQGLSEAYHKTGDSKKAFQYYKLAVQYSDSLLNEENTRKAVQVQMQYDFDKKESTALAEQEKKNVLTAAESRKQKIIIMAVSSGLFLMLILAITVFRSLRVNQEKNRIILLQKEEVERQKHLVEEKQKEILDSIYYARRIQRALITSEGYIGRNLEELRRKIK